MRKYLRRTLLPLLLVSSTFFIVLPVERLLDRHLILLKEGIIDWIEQQIGYTLSYSTIGPFLLRMIQVSDLRIEDDGRELVTIARAQIFYRWSALLTRNPQRAVKRIVIEGSRLRLDLQHDRELLESLFDQPEVSDGAVGFPIEQVSGSNIQLSILDNGREYRADDLFFDVAIREGAIDISGNTLLAIRDPRLPNELSTIDAGITVEASIGTTFDRLQGNVEIDRLVTPLLELRDQSFRIRYDGTMLSVQKIRDRQPLDLSILADLESGDLSLQFRSERFSPAAFLTLRGGLAPFDPWLTGDFTGSAEIAYFPDRRSLSYSAGLEGQIGPPVVSDNLTIVLDTEGSERSIDFRSIAVKTERGVASFQGSVDLETLRPTGQIQFTQFGYAHLAPLNGRLDLEQVDDLLVITAPWLGFGDTNLYNIETTIGMQTANTRIETHLVFDPGDREKVSIEATLGNDPQSLSTIGVHFDGVDPIELLRIAGDIVEGVDLRALDRMGDTYLLDGSVAVDLASDYLRFELPHIRISERDREERSLTLSASGDRSGLNSGEMLLQIGDYRAEAALKGTVARDGAMDLQADLIVQDIPYQMKALLKPRHSLVISGTGGSNEGLLDAQLFFEGDAEKVFAVRGLDMPIPLPDRELHLLLSLEVGGVYRSTDRWEVSVDRLRMRQLDEEGATRAIVTIEGQFGPEGGVVQEIVYLDSLSHLIGSGIVGYEEAWTVDAIMQSEEERHTITASYAGDAVEASIEVQNLSLRRLGFEAIRGTVDGTIAIGGTRLEPHVGVEFQVDDGLFNTDRFRTEGELAYADGILSAPNFTLRYLETEIESTRGRYVMHDGLLDAQFSVTQFGGDDQSRLSIGVEAQIDSAAADSPYDMLQYADLSIDGIELDGERQYWQFAVRRNKGVISLIGAPDNAIEGFLTADNHFRLRLSDPLPIQFAADGRIVGNDIEIDVLNLMVRPAEIPRLLDIEFLQFLDGTLTGSLRIAGPINDPNFYGTLFADRAMASLEFIPGMIGPANGFIVLQGKRVEIYRFEAQTEEGAPFVDIEITLRNWQPEFLRIVVDAPEDRQVRFLWQIAGIDLDGLVQGKMVIEGTLPNLSISGEARANNGTIILGLLQEELEPLLTPGRIAIDLRIVSGTRIEFLWPSSDFPILRATTLPEQEVRLTSDDITSDFNFIGTVGIRGGEIFYFNRNFLILDGEIAFNEHGILFDPLISLRAEIREIAETGPVRIYAIVEDDRLSDLSPRLEANPPLTNAEVASLLGENLYDTTATTPGEDVRSVVLLTGDVISRVAVIGTIERTMRDLFGLDQFTIRTQILQNLLIESLDIDNETVNDSRTDFREYLDNTYLFAGKYLTPDLFLDLLVQLNTANDILIEQANLGPIVEVEFGLEMQTPLFFLSWNFSPKSPQNLYVTDNVFEISWKFGY